MDYDFLFKVLLIGQTSVGKTALLNRFVDDIFHEQSFSTIGVDFKLKTLDVTIKELPRTVKLQLWDTAGQERFHAITSGYFRGAHGVMVIFSLADLETFQRIPYWLDQVENQNVSCKILIGNKCDLTPHQVTDEMISNFCSQHPDLKYVQTSAKTGSFVEGAFMEMATTLAEYMTSSRQMALAKHDGPRIVKAQDDGKHEGNVGTKCCGGTG